MTVGDHVYIWGRHNIVVAVTDDRAQIVPVDSSGKRTRKPHPFDWTSKRLIERRGIPSRA